MCVRVSVYVCVASLQVVLASGVALWSFFTLVTPEAAALGAAPLIGARVLLGVGEGVAFPSIHSLIARNVPQVCVCVCVCAPCISFMFVK